MTTLWHGRFADGPAEALWQFTVSLPFDQRLGPDDVVASKAHVRGLVRGRLVTPQEGDVLLAALDKAGAELADGSFVFLDSDEDIHTAIERRVTQMAGA